MMDDLDARLSAVISRAQATSSRIGGRTKVNFQGLDNESGSNVELLLPPGYVARPRPGADHLLMQVNGQRDHKVLLGGDHAADLVANLAEGESGLSSGGQSLLLRLGKTVSVSPMLAWGLTEAAVSRLVTEKFMALFNSHTHGGGKVPDQQMNASHLTGGS